MREAQRKALAFFLVFYLEVPLTQGIASRPPGAGERNRRAEADAAPLPRGKLNAVRAAFRPMLPEVKRTLVF
jgi:hypothetical protein